MRRVIFDKWLRIPPTWNVQSMNDFIVSQTAQFPNRSVCTIQSFTSRHTSKLCGVCRIDFVRCVFRLCFIRISWRFQRSKRLWVSFFLSFVPCLFERKYSGGDILLCALVLVLFIFFFLNTDNDKAGTENFQKKNEYYTSLNIDLYVWPSTKKMFFFFAHRNRYQWENSSRISRAGRNLESFWNLHEFSMNNCFIYYFCSADETTVPLTDLKIEASNL